MIDTDVLPEADARAFTEGIERFLPDENAVVHQKTRP